MKFEIFDFDIPFFCFYVRVVGTRCGAPGTCQEGLGRVVTDRIKKLEK